MDLLEAFRRWKARNSHRSEGTHKRYEYGIRRLCRVFPRVHDVTPERYRAFQVAELARGSSSVYVRTDVAALCAVLSALVKEIVLPLATLAQIRADTLRPSRGERRRRRARFLTREEHARLLETAARVEPRMVAPINVAAWAGPRTGELARMRGDDRVGRLLTIEARPEWGEAGACKTGPRTVPVCDELAAILDTLPRSGWLFPSSYSGRGRMPRYPFLSIETLQTGLARVREEAGIPDATWRVLRHTRASWWLQGSPQRKGASIYKVADWLGHSVATCEQYYGALLDAYDPECESAPAA